MGVGVASGLGLLGRRRYAGDDPLSVTVWFTEAALSHAGVETRAIGYLRRALETAVGDVDVDRGARSISPPSEEGTRLMTRWWPATVARGVAGRGPVDDVGDVSLLVTDGDPRRRPAGYGLPGVGTVSGARLLSQMLPVDADGTVVDPTPSAVVTQLLLHECGHALGLRHRHGTVTRAESGEAVVASPMVGRYAWTRPDEDVGDADRCGHAYPATDGGRRQLALTYGSCATAALRAR